MTTGQGLRTIGDSGDVSGGQDVLGLFRVFADTEPSREGGLFGPAETKAEP